MQEIQRRSEEDVWWRGWKGGCRVNREAVCVTCRSQVDRFVRQKKEKGKRKEKEREIEGKCHSLELCISVFSYSFFFVSLETCSYLPKGVP